MFGGNITQRIAAWRHAHLDQASGQRGASMVEYALLLVLVLLIAFVSVAFFGESVVAIFDASTTSFDPAPSTTN